MNLYFRIFNFLKYIIYYYGLAVWVFIPRTIEKILGIYPHKNYQSVGKPVYVQICYCSIIYNSENLEYVDT